jgi:hypothetical protein
MLPRTRRAAAASILLGLMMVAPLAGVALADDTSGGGIGGFTMSANGNGLQVIFDNPNGLGGSHPIAYVGVPEASADFETGPLGLARASVIWPGSLLGNFGAAAPLFFPPPFGQYFKNLNDPIRAEAHVPGGPADATYPPAASGAAAPSSAPPSMVSHADNNNVTANAGVGGINIAGLIQSGSISSHGATALTNTAATSTGTSSVTGVDILGGLIRIDSVKSTATADSDGTKAHGSGSTVVGGVSLLNGAVPVTIDNSGFHVGKANTPLGGLLGSLDAALNPILKALNLRMRTLPTITSSSGSQYNVVASGLVISYDLPASLTGLINTLWLKLPQLPGVPSIPSFLQGGFVTMTLGGAIANVNASPAFVPPADAGSSDIPSAPVAAGPAPSTDAGASSGSGVNSPSTGDPGISSPALAGTPTALAPTIKRPTTSDLPLSPIGYFKGLKLLAVLLAALGTIFLAGGLAKLCTDVLDPKAVTVCSLEGGP